MAKLLLGYSGKLLRMWAGIDKVDGVPWRTIFIPALLGEPPVVVQRRDNNTCIKVDVCKLGLILGLTLLLTARNALNKLELYGMVDDASIV